MDDRELQAWVERVSLEWFGRPFRHRATFNPRLRTTGGRYFLKTHNIEINPKQLEQFGPEETEKIIKHELCHYHLHLMNRGYRHRDRDFRELLAKVGGTRYCRSLPGARPKTPRPARYVLECRSCGASYPRRRKMDPRRYVCGSCGGNLRLYMLDFNIES